MSAKIRCPRCSGNLYLNRDEDDAVWSCLQCSRSFRPARRAAHQPAALGR